ncbi:putative lipid-transfer protein DIR1 [Dioscorea sansibarensis]
MEVTMMKCLSFCVLMVVLGVVGVEMVDGAGECGSVPVNRMALRMAPCAAASQDPQVSASCCSAVQKMGQSPSCLCAVMLSDTAKSVGVKPEVAITIPKRCNLADRPVGYKCGGELCLNLLPYKCLHINIYIYIYLSSTMLF